jgi:hypothetical protein
MDNRWLTKEQLEKITAEIPFDDIQDIYFSCDSGFYVKVGKDSKGILYVLESGLMSCIKGDFCDITQEATCCFECKYLKECKYPCDNESCQKYPKDDPCPYCRIEELEDELMDITDYADALEEENEVLLQELLISKDEIIGLQRELLEKHKVWQ